MRVSPFVLACMLCCGDDSSELDASSVDAAMDAAADATVDSSDASTDASTDASGDASGDASTDVSTDVSSDASSLPTITLEELKAFPTAHGYGRHASGGRGGRVIKVTNTNTNGPGSFRDAYANSSGPRTIVFEVSGNIDYGSVMYADDDDVTIAGQTAPGDGVALFSTVGGISHEASNAIIRHVRFRGSEGDRSNLRLLGTGGDLTDVIVDHCSFSWADPDEMNIGMTGNTPSTVHDVTIQYSINTNTNRGFLMYQNVYRVSVLRNYMGQILQRAVRANHPNVLPAGVHWFEEINNVLHGLQTPPIQPSLGGRFAAIANIYSQSEAIAMTNEEVVRGQNDGTGTPSETYAHVVGNINETVPGDIQTSLTPYLRDEPYESTDYVGSYILDASSLEAELLSYVGARWYDARDAQDTAALALYADRAGALVFDGTPPPLESDPAPADSDDDGMSDAFEIAHGLDEHDPEDRNETRVEWTFPELIVVNNAGYTNLEIYLAYLARDFDLILVGMESES